MWIFTQHGFASAVQHRNDPTLLVVRFRDDRDAASYAQALKEANARRVRLPRVTRNDRADYLWRMIVPAKQWAALLAKEAEAIDYGNFKGMMHERRPAWTELGSIWSHTMRHQEKRNERRRAETRIFTHATDYKAPHHEASDDDEIVYTADEAERFTGTLEPGPF